MSRRDAGGVKEWAEDVALRLLKDLSIDDDAWEMVFDWVLENVRLGESYPSVLRKARRWQRGMACRVAMRFAKQKTDVPPDFQGDPEVHGIDEPRGGGFSIMQDLQKSLVKEEDKRASMPQRGFESAVREAMYWCSPGRTYRLTRQEQGEGPVSCPRCKSQMETEPFTKSEKMYRCPECGFKIPTGKVTTKRVEIEIEPDGGVEVEVKGRSASTTYELIKDTRTKKGAEFKAGDRLRVVKYNRDYPYIVVLEDDKGQRLGTLPSLAHKMLKGFPKPPSVRQMEKWVDDGVAKSIDGKRVEPDSFSSGGAPSWLLVLGMI
jgi:DNA-directed RNA polymerase subunit RPC12/RpoP